MTENNVDMSIVDKVRKILAKAESTDSEAEAETFYAKATELMQQHMIDEAMLIASGKAEKDEIDKLVVKYGSTYWLAWRTVLTNLGFAFGFRCLLIDNGKNGSMAWFGWRSKLHLAEMLLASLEIQVERAANNHMRAYVSPYDLEIDGAAPIREDRFKEKRSFIEGFGSTVANRIREQRNLTRREESAKHQSDGSLLPVLVDRDRQLKDFFDNLSTRPARLKNHAVNASGFGAGRRAGETADINNPRLGGSRGSLTRGR